MKRSSSCRPRPRGSAFTSILLVSALAIVLLLAVLLWRNRYYMYTIRRKNKAMVDTVAGLLAYKERLLLVGGQTEEGLAAFPPL